MIQLIIVGLTVLANLTLALIVYKNNRKSATNLLLFSLCIVAMLWTVFNYVALSAELEAIKLTYVRLVMLITSPLAPLIYLLAVTFPHKKIPENPIVNAFIIITTSLSAILAATPLMFRDLEMLSNGNFRLIPGPAIAIFGLNTFIFLIWGFLVLIKKFRKSTGLLRKQTGFFLFGMIAAWTLSLLTNFVAVVIFDTIQLTFIGPSFNLIMIGTIGYAIIKHRFLDIRLIVARSIAYLLLVSTLAGIYVGGLLALQQFLFTDQVSRQYTISSAALSLGMILLFQPLLRIFKNVTENIFYKREYDAQEFLHNLSSITSHNLILKTLVSKVVEEIKNNLKPIGVAIALVEENNPIQFQGFGLDNKKTENKKLNYNQALTIFQQALEQKKEQILVFEELEKGDVKNYMRELNLSIVVPLKMRDEFIGGLLLKRKSSGELYSVEDIRLLKIIAPQLAVAIKNALSFEEIKNFNIKLKQEIEKATSNLKKANLKLQELDKLKNEFVSIASHELRTPMTAIRNYLWMALNRSEEELPVELKEQLEVAYQSVERLIHLVKDMLTVSRIEAGKISLDKEKLDWNETVEQVHKELRPIADKKQIDFPIKTSEKSLKIFADKTRIMEVLQNIIGNALKFTPDKGRVAVEIRVEKDQVITTIEDTGPGIAEEDLKKLFTKFTVINTYEKAKDSGTGLGLYISRQIVNLHDGTIEASSKLGEGTTFSIFLPQHQP